MSKIKLSNYYIKNTVKLALNEDLYPSGDITSGLVKENKIIKLKLISNQNAVIGGLEFAKQTFKLIDKKIRFEIKKKEGSSVKKNELIAIIKGKATNILIFQTDVHIRRFGIEKFLKYDYVGAPWHRSPPLFKCDLRVGNGGFSLRKKWQMIKIITTCSLKKYLKEYNNRNEDLYFAYFAQKLDLKVPHPDEAKKFSVEHVYYPDPIGTHQASYEIY